MLSLEYIAYFYIFKYHDVVLIDIAIYYFISNGVEHCPRIYIYIYILL